MGLRDMDILALGCGQMASALLGGAHAAGAFEGARLHCVDLDPSRAEALASSTGGQLGWPRAEGPRLVCVAVKPHQVEALLRRHRDTWSVQDTLVSVAAGVPLALMRAWAGPKPALVRTMPNTPSLVGAGVTGLFPERTDTEAWEAVLELFSAVGEVVRLSKESDFDALTAISGSGPAYMFVALEALADGGVRMGLSREVAADLARATLAGAAALAASDVHPAQLKDRVASPGGTTIEALARLEALGFRHALIEAVAAAAGRSRELSEIMLAAHIGDETGP